VDPTARRPGWQVLLIYAGLSVLGASAALAGMGLIPASEQSLGPVSVATGAHVGRPMTTLQVPPVGAISARTHDAPLAVNLAVTEVDPLAFGRLLSESPDEQAIVDQLTEAIQRAASGLAIRIIVGGAILGGLLLALLPGRRWSWVVAGIAGGLIGTAAILALTWTGFSPDAFREPAFTGSLERAPQLIRAIQEQNLSFNEARSRARGAAARLSRALSLLGQPVDDPHAGTVAILHIGDVHSNPLGLEFARELASRFQVDAIVDTGDLTSFGEPIEARIGELVASMGVPYLFAAGNHDSQPIRDAIGALPNVVLLDGGVHQVGDVRIQGFADPTFTAAGRVSNDQHTRAVRASSREVGVSVESEKPDVLAVHHPRLADASLGKVPLVLAGHRHRQASRRSGDTLVLEVGSSGATGLGSFLADIDLAYEAQIVYFRNGRATAYDYVRLHGLGSDFQIQRRTLELQGPRSDSRSLPQEPPPGSPSPGLAPPEPSPAPQPPSPSP
jgi:Icc-related predicted phosphoesterase